MRYEQRSAAVLLAALAVGACDDGAQEEEFPAGGSVEALAYVATAGEGAVAPIVGNGSPLTDDATAKGVPGDPLSCDLTGDGLCPTVSVECAAARDTITVVTLDFGDGCTDPFGVSVSGEIVFTHNGIGDWTVSMADFVRGDAIFSGSWHVVRQGVGVFRLEPSVQIAMEIMGMDESDCTETNDICRQTYSLHASLELGTDSYFILTLGDDRLVIDGDMRGRDGHVFGDLSMDFLGRDGRRRLLSLRPDHSLRDHHIALAALAYAWPPTCTCPHGGQVVMPSLIDADVGLDCGSLRMDWAAGGGCAAATVAHGGSEGGPCDSVAHLAKLAADGRCAPTGE